ncbi:MAG: glycosyltransferase [Deltaproteobacteria bacterium]|jgi:glycosyltransferase involved in cell wall biosynthesis|nr:glycosyltransferase [Deltaproteobacteria bacterium]
MIQTPKLSLVIPCYNEAPSLPGLLKRLDMAALSDARVEFVLVDNGSSDSSVEAIKSAACQRPNLLTAIRIEGNRGFGFGVLQGLAVAKGEFLGWSHADLQTDPLDALRALEIIDQHPDPEKLYLKGTRCARPASDLVFTLGMSFFETLFFQSFLWDINAQPNIFHRSFFTSWKNPPHDFALELYALALARRYELKVIRFPVLFENRRHGISRWNVNWRSKIRFIKRTLSFSIKLRQRWSSL